MAAKRAAKQAKKLAAAQPQWAIDRVYKSAAVLETLREAGDDETATRPIEHTAIFKTEPAAYGFAKALYAAGGYNDIKTGPADAAGVVIVEFNEPSTTASKEIFDKTVIAEGRVREAGGEYDGWSAVLVAKAV